MSDFLRGWRRKAGLVSLMLACACLSMWVRSTMISDVGYWGHEAFFSGGGLFCFSYDANDYARLRWHGDWIRISNYGYLFNLVPDDRCHVRCWGLTIGNTAGAWVLVASYAWPTIPLALLSAWLLLFGKPRKPQPTQEPANQ